MIVTSATIALDRAVVAATGILTVYGAATLLSSDVFGVFVIAESVRVGILTVADAPLGQATIQRGAAPEVSLPSILGRTLFFKAIALLLVALVCWIVAGLGLLSGEWSSLLKAMPVWAAMSAVQATAQQALTARRAYGGLLLADTGALVMILGGGLVLHSHLTDAAAVMWLVSTVKLLTGSPFLLWNGVSFRRAQNERDDKFLIYSAHSLLNNVATFANLKADAILVGIFAGSHETARWGLAAPVISMYMLIGEAANTELFPAVASIEPVRSRASLQMAVRSSGTLWCGAAFALSLALFVLPLGNWLDQLSRGRHELDPVLWILSVAGPVLVVGRVSSSVNNGMGHPRHNATATLWGLAVKVTAGTLCVWQWGAVGAAVGILAVAITAAAISAILARREAESWAPA